MALPSRRDTILLKRQCSTSSSLHLVRMVGTRAASRAVWRPCAVASCARRAANAAPSVANAASSAAELRPRDGAMSMFFSFRSGVAAFRNDRDEDGVLVFSAQRGPDAGEVCRGRLNSFCFFSMDFHHVPYHAWQNMITNQKKTTGQKNKLLFRPVVGPRDDDGAARAVTSTAKIQNGRVPTRLPLAFPVTHQARGGLGPKSSLRLQAPPWKSSAISPDLQPAIESTSSPTTTPDLPLFALSLGPISQQRQQQLLPQNTTPRTGETSRGHHGHPQSLDPRPLHQEQLPGRGQRGRPLVELRDICPLGPLLRPGAAPQRVPRQRRQREHPQGREHRWYANFPRYMHAASQLHISWRTSVVP